MHPGTSILPTVRPCPGFCKVIPVSQRGEDYVNWSYKGPAQEAGHKNQDILEDNIIFYVKCEWVTTLKHVSQVHTARNVEAVKFTQAMAEDHVAIQARF